MPNLCSINKDGLDIIKKFESYKKYPYLCPAKVWTVGYGRSIYHNGRQLTETSDPMGVIAMSLYPNGVTIKEAEGMLIEDANDRAKQVKGVLKVELNENQFSALVSFTFNVGIDNLKNSTLLRKLNSGDFIGAADEFPKWRKSGGVVLNGLVRRRAEERALFLKK